MHPTHYVWSKAHVLGGFAPFGCRKYTIAKSGPGMPFGHEFVLMKLLSSFTAKTHPIHYFRFKTHNLCGFAPFRCSKCTVAKSVSWDAVWARVRANGTIFEFSCQNASNPLLLVKTHILGDFAPFVCHKSTVTKSGPRMLFWHELGPTKQLLSFSHKMHSIH
jgi:hypothetical protein